MPFVLNFENARKGDELTSQRSGLRFQAELSEWDIKEFLTQLFHSHTPSYKEVTYRVAIPSCHSEMLNVTASRTECNSNNGETQARRDQQHGRLDWILDKNNVLTFFL